jgi:CheY-like chemotaxis protein
MCPERHILLVDDDSSIRSILEQTLAEAGYTVRTAENGQAALEALTGFRPCVILLNLWMPVLDGWEFLRAYRRLPHADGRVITLTAYPETPPAGEDLPVDGHIDKPFDIDALLGTVEQHTTLHPAR